MQYELSDAIVNKPFYFYSYMQAVEIYKAKDGKTQVEVKFENNSVWLNQYQLAELFSTDRTSILKHLKNIYKTKELDLHQTCAKIAQVQKEGKKTVTREILHYNLDAIISVGYRVNSKRGVQFRQWATQRLNDYLVKGYAINKERLNQLEQVVKIIQQSGNTKQLNAQETRGLLDIITNYTQSFILLNRFDSHSLSEEKLNENITYEIDYDDAVKAIEELKKQLTKRKEASELFGKQKDKSFAGILKTVVQTFDKNIYMQALKSRQHTCYILLSRIILSQTAINALALFYLYGFLKKINIALKKPVKSKSMIMLWWH